MARHSRYRITDYLEAAQVFHWATKTHYVVWFTGVNRRHKRTEALLPYLVRKGKLKVCKHRKEFAYSAPRKSRKHDERMCYPFIDHGLACTEGLVRFWRSNMDAEIIPEYVFKGCGIVPEWGLRFPNGKLLLYEHSTRNNFEHAGIVSGKISHYERLLEGIEKKFGAEEAIVLFVLDIERERVQTFVDKKVASREFFFTDYKTFLSVPIGQQLYVPIYIWGGDSESYPLSKHHD
jgi:hypothetical protein